MRQALEMALEALEESHPEAYRHTITAIKEALAQPEQEPVACVQDLGEVKRKHLVYEKGMDWKDPLYTTPPQRTWVGLNTNQILYIYQKVLKEWRGGHQVNGQIAFAKAIQDKFKEVNT